jgi:hypothetical protein
MKKIKSFKKWKKERKRILRAKGIKISKITEGDWKRRYGAAKFRTLFWSNPKNRKKQGNRMRKRYKEGTHPIQNPKNLEKIIKVAKQKMKKLVREGKHTFQNPVTKRHSLEAKRKRNFDWCKKPHSWSIGKKNCMHKPEVKAKVYTKERSEKLKKSMIKRIKSGEFKLTPNKSELFLMNILNQMYPRQWRYTGDGKFWIGNRNPDFINKKDKRIIELFGDFWHNLKDGRPTEIQRKNNYKKEGYDCLVIWHRKDKLWEHPENVANKIERWNDA